MPITAGFRNVSQLLLGPVRQEAELLLKVGCHAGYVFQDDLSCLERTLKAENAQRFRFKSDPAIFQAGGWGDYANAVAGKVGAVLFAGCVAGVEGEGKDE